MTNQYPRREKKKKITRDTIKEAALHLFAEKGYEDTTLGNIAEAADLHLQTLYRHFASKSELAASIDQDFFLHFQDAFAERTENTLVFWRQWVELSCKEILKSGAKYRRAIVKLLSAPDLRTTYLDTWFEYQKLLATGIAQDMGVSKEQDPRPFLIASTLWAGHLFALRRWVESNGKRDLLADCLEVVDTTMELWNEPPVEEPLRKQNAK